MAKINRKVTLPLHHIANMSTFSHSVISPTPTLFSSALLKSINRLQCVQNTLARVVASHPLPQDTHSSGILKYLHWLPIEQRIRFKLATLTHNALCSAVYALQTPTCCLLLVFAQLLPFASRGFSVAAPTVWNSLPSGIHDSSSTHTFRHLLKNHCFQQVFGSP